MAVKNWMGVALAACLIAGFGAIEPAEAGTCMPVKAKGFGKNVTKATEAAQANLKDKAKAIRGKITQSSSNCSPNLLGTVCKIDAVVCPT
jgi:hypothetical protein